jgi:hypothetical protein
MAITSLKNLLAFTEGSELITGGDFTGTNGDTPNAWWDASGGTAGNTQEIQSNKGEIDNPNDGGSSYIGRSDIGANYLGADGAQVPLVIEGDFTITTNAGATNSWYNLLQLYTATDEFTVGIGKPIGTSPGEWDTHGYGIQANIGGTHEDPNSPNIIVASSDTSGKMRTELLAMQNYAGTWSVYAYGYYWNGSKWICINPNRAYTGFSNSLGNTQLYLNGHSETGGSTVLPGTWDNVTAKTITDNVWTKDVSTGFRIEYGNGVIRCDDHDIPSSGYMTYGGLFTDGEQYKINVTVEDYANGELLFYLGARAMPAIYGNGTHTIIGTHDSSGGTYDDLWMQSRYLSNDYTITALTVEPGQESIEVSGGLIGGSLGFEGFGNASQAADVDDPNFNFDFTGDNGDPLPTRHFSEVATGNGTGSIQSNAYEMDVDASSAGLVKFDGVQEWPGYFDIRVDWSEGAGSDANFWIGTFKVTDTVSGYYYQISRLYTSSNFYRCDYYDGSFNIGTNLATTDTSGKFRILRNASNALNLYYWNGSAWAQTVDNDTHAGITGTFVAQCLFSNGDTFPSHTFSWDNTVST